MTERRSLVCAGKPRDCRGRRKGFALVLVLVFLVLLTGLAVAYFTNITTELNSASSYSNEAASKQLADSVAQLAMGTIRKATGGGTTTAWASQPGMIHTYDANGTPGTCYKLFSSDHLEVASPYDPSGSLGGVKEIDDAWATETAAYTDLNAPVVDGTGAANFPIVDPNASSKVDGFAINGAPTKYTGAYPPVGFNPATDPNPAPMPVRWLYMLQDGTLTPALAGSNTVANFAANQAPTATNPIVGRVAYWADDDTCKVNVNTASEGVYWDLPRLLTLEEAGTFDGQKAINPGLAICQPAKGEYQRYPGHPATTCLSPVLRTLLPAPDPSQAVTAANVPLLKAYYDLVPRVKDGGSLGGTTIPDVSGSSTGSAGAIVPDTDRLYASVDELLFKASQISSGSEREVNAGLSAAALRPLKFFLTAHSNAPETTMFNTPRVSMWPEYTNAALGTLYDGTIAFCSTLLGGSTKPLPYYFTRLAGDSNGRGSGSRSMTADFSARNEVLYKYLLKMMSTSIPGFGGTFDAKYGAADNHQLLTSIYDRLRCVNMYDKTPAVQGAPGGTPYTALVSIKSATAGGGEVLPISIKEDGIQTQGFGRWYTVSSVDILFSGVPKLLMVSNTPASDPNARKLYGIQAGLMVTFNSPMQGLPPIFANLKYTISGLETFRVDGQQIFKTAADGTNGTEYILGSSLQTANGAGLGGEDDPRFTGDLSGYMPAGKTVSPAASSPKVSPFVSNGNFKLSNPTASTFSFKGGTITIALIASDTGVTVQTIKMTFPDAPAGFPMPTLSTTVGPGINFATGGGYSADTMYPTGAVPPMATISYSGKRSGSVWSCDTDRAVELGGPGDNPSAPNFGSTNTSAGDVRMIAALPTVGTQYFYPQQDYNNVNAPQATGLVDSTGSAVDYPYSSKGALARGMHPEENSRSLAYNLGGVPSYADRSPSLPSRATDQSLSGVTRANQRPDQPGDWDTGFGVEKDGAYLNMGDIGDSLYFSIENGALRYPYVSAATYVSSADGEGSYFSPNRQVASALILGSIPTGVMQNKPWQTLLFNPKPEDPSHPGRGAIGSIPPDHLIADLLWMPVVEPYAISQPFSTAGKINMNYQIQPFNYIQRSTGMYAVMKATKFMAIPASIYQDGNKSFDPKPWNQSGASATAGALSRSGPAWSFRRAIDIAKTLAAFDARFKGSASTPPDVFRSASQICELNLVAQGTKDASTATMAQFWSQNTLTGDNLREKPYADLYPRLTTKSNSYTVHFKVQILKKSRNTAVNQWVDGQDQVVSEFRGSSEIERYLDSSDSTLPDFATTMVSNPTDASLNLDQYCHYRVVSTKKFAP